MRKNKEQGFIKLKELYQNQLNVCYIIICGGDGTVMWVISQANKFSIDNNKVLFGVLAFGTGNDFSRSLGWGSQAKQLTSNSFKNLKIMIRQWVNAKIQQFDLWDIQAQTYQVNLILLQKGKFQKVQDNKNIQIPQKILKRSFCNYFSFGIDGKIGYSFDSRRKQSRLANFITYAYVGIIRTMTPTKNLQELLDTIQIGSTNLKMQLNSQIQQSQIDRNSKIQIKSSSYIKKKKSQQQKKQKNNAQQKNVFRNSYYNIVALNINSYAAGISDIWKNAKKGFIKNSQNNDYKNQVSSGDGKLQFVAFGSSFGIAMQKTFGGWAKKIIQTQGPVTFNFLANPNKQKHRTYLQIDGQYIRFTHPKRVTIKKSQITPNGKVKVLRYVEINN